MKLSPQIVLKGDLFWLSQLKALESLQNMLLAAEF